MKHFLPTSVSAFLLFLTSLAAVAQPCQDGFSGSFPCDRIDQLAHRSLSYFGVEDANDSWGWTSPATGREYVMIGLHDRTAFLDISTPTYPIYLGYLPTATIGSVWRDIKVVDHYAYIVSEAYAHGMQVFDLSRLESLSAAEVPFSFDADAWYTGFGHCHNIVADTANKFVYPVGTGQFQGGLFAIDVSDPLSPQYAGSNSLGGYVHDAQALTYSGPDAEYTGRQIVVGFNENRMVVYDATDKTDIEIVSESVYENIGYTHQGWFTEDQHYLISNDETDEIDYGINTRSIIWDMSDLDNPELISYVDLGNPSIDHNLYIRGDMVFEANYTSGLRVYDILDIAQGELSPFGYFDVYPQSDQPIFEGAWSNYPWFESGVVAVSSITSGLHLLRPRFITLSDTVIRVCDANTASFTIDINRRFAGEVDFDVDIQGISSADYTLDFSTTQGAPAQNTVHFNALSALAPGYYPGVVSITQSGQTTELAFVVVKGQESVNPAPTLISPQDEVFPDQTVTFTWSAFDSGYAVLEVALDSDFNDIVFQKTYYVDAFSVQAEMPFDLTTYFWRIRLPDACGTDQVSPTGTFTIDVSSSVQRAIAGEAFSVYPNPAKHAIYVQVPARLRGLIHIFDVAGREVVVQQISTGESHTRIPVSDLKPGVYIIRCDRTTRAVKFVKN